MGRYFKKWAAKVARTAPAQIWLPRSLLGRVAGALCVVTGVAAGTNFWIDRTAAPLIFSDIDEIPAKPTAIVLGALVYNNGSPSAILRDRLDAALKLYLAKKVDRILVSGDHASDHYDEVNPMWRWLVRRGVDRGDIFLDHAGLRTLDTMARAKSVFGVKQAVVCTQEFHLSRALFLAKRAGIDAVGLVADQRRYAHHRRNRVRETIAKSVSFMDSYVFHTPPRFGGEQIPISGDARQSHDKKTRL